MTAAAAGTIGKVRRDPMAMLPFCGYHMGDYFGHWILMQKSLSETPRIFHVNWFRKDADGKFLWPGYGENSRVLEWIFHRITDKAPAIETPIGAVPTVDAIDTTGLDVTEGHMKELLRVDIEGWRAEVPLIREYYAQFGDRLPQGLADQVDTLEQRLG